MTFKDLIKATPAYPALRAGHSVSLRVVSEVAWRIRGRPAPTPPTIKRRALRKAAKRNGLRYFVETGTYQGDTIAALLDDFDLLYSVELFDPLYERATARFADQPRVRLRHGDSGSVLPEILDELPGPALMWLDAHDSGPGTGAAEMDPPAAEVAAIFSRPERHVIYIDDAQTFTGAGGYPTVQELQVLTEQHRPGWRCIVVDDMIRIEP